VAQGVRVPALVEFSHEVTLGDLLGVLATLSVAALGLAWWLREEWRRKHPFTVRVSEEPLAALPNKGIPGERSYSCGTGRRALTLAILCSQETVDSPFDLRFVERDWLRWWAFKNASQSAIEMTAVSVPEWKKDEVDGVDRDFVGANTVTVEPNGVGGFRVARRKPQRWIVGQILWIETTWDAKTPWQGYLSFEGRTNRRAFGRVSARVI
jgi:hypothetical protein